jgi:exosome complex component RRP41
MSGGGTSIRRTDLLALSNLRHDGRKPHEVRRIQIQMGVLPASVGSAIVEMGLTSCLAIVTGPTECLRRSDELADRAILDVSLHVTPFATADRRVFNPNTDRRLIEGAVQIQHALEAAILLQTYPKSRICIHISVLSDDGGRLCTAINAATMALIDAGIPMKDFCCACSAGGSNSSDSTTVLVDLNRMEETSSNTGTTTASIPMAILPQRGTIVLAQCSEARLPDFTSMELITEAAIEGCHTIFESMQAAVANRATSILTAYRGQTEITT